MFPAEVFLNSREIAESSRWVMVNAAGLRAKVDFSSNFLAALLLQLPWQIMASAMELKVLLSLKPFVAYFADESVRRHEGFG